ncbi:GerMN domain-containing protein [Leptolyngbya sp. FACHB-17]|uniref:GerMN domain-containing protein n=1 Tax=unclassified Leptolyngbya TaxID=2650499 RepID=UPI001681B347|nr:GerMN domain-containing protein [Leptolyngbya sp. FACHB-17]MBD2078929.1 GerMN domain-containing protein [Leptolyngbya sp. FACHB-17]
MPKDKRRFPLGIVVGLSTLVVATGGATAFFTWQNTHNSQSTPVAVKSPQANAPASVPSAPAASQNPIQVAATEKTAQVYWLKDSATDLELAPVAVKVKSADRDEARLTAAFNTLFSAAPSQDLSSGVPKGTTLRSLKVKSDSIYVNLSKAFTSGGGSSSMTGRLAQVLYTATSLNPNAKVFLLVEGKPLTVLGGEGLIVDQPLTRSQFEQETGTKQE